MNKQQALEVYTKQRRKMLANRYASFVCSWDMQTDAAPQSVIADSEQMGVLGEQEYELFADASFREAVETLCGCAAELDEVLRHEVTDMKKHIDETAKIP